MPSRHTDIPSTPFPRVATANSWQNRWSDYDQYPQGGYLDDFWVYDKTVHSKARWG
jgi:hypothetical protein